VLTVIAASRGATRAFVTHADMDSPVDVEHLSAGKEKRKAELVVRPIPWTLPDVAGVPRGLDTMYALHGVPYAHAPISLLSLTLFYLIGKHSKWLLIS
jgi:hypothetical protein